MCLCLLTLQVSFAQTPNKLNLFEEYYELEQETNTDYEEFLNNIKGKMSIVEFIKDPNIYLQFISEVQRTEIKEHIEQTGELLDLLELQTLQSINFNDYQKLSAVIDVGKASYFSPKNKSIRYQNRWAYQSKRDDQNYKNTWGRYEVLKVDYKQFKLGLARELDLGEEVHSQYILGQYDHLASYLNYKTKHAELNIGTYQVFQGMGLLVGQGYNRTFGSGGIQNISQQRLLGSANQSEYNTFKGVYLKRSWTKFHLAVAYSHQKIDSGTQTGYHRTPTELARKDKLTESVFLLGISKLNRKYAQHVLVLKEIEAKPLGLSYANHYYWRNTVSFAEISNYKNRTAITLGAEFVFIKQMQLSVAYTHYEAGYESAWMSRTVQTISLSKEKGIVFCVLLPLKRSINLQYNYRFSTNENNNHSGKNNYSTHTIRLDKTLNKDIVSSLTLFIQNNNIDGDNEEESYSKESLLKSRLTLQLNNKEAFSQEYHLYIHSNFQSESKAILYQLKYKTKKAKYLYSIAYYNVLDNIEIYLTFTDIIRNRNTQAVYSSGMRQSFGIEHKIFHKLTLSSSILSVYDQSETQYKIVFNLNYP